MTIWATSDTMVEEFEEPKDVWRVLQMFAEALVPNRLIRVASFSDVGSDWMPVSTKILGIASNNAFLFGFDTPSIVILLRPERPFVNLLGTFLHEVGHAIQPDLQIVVQDKGRRLVTNQLAKPEFASIRATAQAAYAEFHIPDADPDHGFCYLRGLLHVVYRAERILDVCIDFERVLKTWAYRYPRSAICAKALDNEPSRLVDVPLTVVTRLPPPVTWLAFQQEWNHRCVKYKDDYYFHLAGAKYDEQDF